MTRHDDKQPISDAHARFLDDLSAAVDGDADALAAAADLLAESDEARDLLFDMKRVANRVGDAGDDFVPQPGLDARVLAALDARAAQAAPAAPAATRAPVATSPAVGAPVAGEPVVGTPIVVAAFPTAPVTGTPVAGVAAPVFQAVASPSVPDPLESRWAGGAGRDRHSSLIETSPEKKRPSLEAEANERAAKAAPGTGMRRSGLALVVGGGALFAIAAAATLAYVGGAFGGAPDAPMAAAQGWSAEDMALQSMPDASPAKWHLAHTSWFFEALVLGPHAPGYRPHDERFARLFNSYYESLGPRHPRPQRGMLTRPSLAEVLSYRAAVDAVHAFLASRGDVHILHAPQEEPWAPGYYSVLIEDPDGIRIEFNHVPGVGLLVDGEEIGGADAFDGS